MVGLTLPTQVGSASTVTASRVVGKASVLPHKARTTVISGPMASAASGAKVNPLQTKPNWGSWLKRTGWGYRYVGYTGNGTQLNALEAV